MINPVSKLNAFAYGVLLLLAAASCTSHQSSGDKVYFSVKTFPSGNGWGYNVLTNDTVYIHQETIPAIQGLKPFATEEQAKKTGTLVMQKLLKGKHPTITVQELDSCKIQYR